jgi:hypothetical protein
VVPFSLGCKTPAVLEGKTYSLLLNLGALSAQAALPVTDSISKQPDDQGSPLMNIPT